MQTKGIYTKTLITPTYMNYFTTAAVADVRRVIILHSVFLCDSIMPDKTKCTVGHFEFKTSCCIILLVGQKKCGDDSVHLY